MKIKGIQLATQLSAFPSPTKSRVLITVLLVLAGAATAAEADNRVTIFQNSLPAGSENSVINIYQQGAGNFVGGETQIDTLAQPFTVYFLNDFNADGDFNDLVLRESCGEGCTTFRFIQRESQNLIFDLNGDGDTTDPGESGDLDGDPNNDALFWVDYDDANNFRPSLNFIDPNDPNLFSERFVNSQTQDAVAFDESDFDGRSTMTGQGLEVGIVQIGDNNQTAFNLTSDQGQVEVGLFGNDNRSTVRIGEGEANQSLSEVRITAYGNNNAISTEVGSYFDALASDRTLVEVTLEGDDNTVITRNEGIESKTLIRGDLSQTVLDLEQRGDGNFAKVDFESDSGTASGIRLLLRQSAFDDNFFPVAGGLQNHIELLWRHGSDSSLILQQYGNDHFMKIENFDAGTTGSTVDIRQQGAAQDVNLTLRGGNQVINIDQMPGPGG
jgi:hypothetical protein